MPAKSSKGLKICITKGGATATVLSPTAISKASPAVVTATTTGLAVGMVVTMVGTGFSELDGKSFVVGSITPNTSFTLLGADLTKSTGTFTVGTAKANYYAATDMVCLCLASLTFNLEEAGTISTATYCDPTASIPSAVQAAGTLSFTGFVDVGSVDYMELLIASEDNLTRIVRIELPGNGYLIAPITFSSLGFDLPLDGAIGYTGSGVLGSKMRHLF